MGPPERAAANHATRQTASSRLHSHMRSTIRRTPVHQGIPPWRLDGYALDERVRKLGSGGAVAELDEADDLLQQIAPEYRKALADWASMTQRQLRYAEWKAGPGYTSAKLYGAYVAERGERLRGVIIKVWLHPDDVPREPARHNIAVKASPRFALGHLVQIAYDPLPLGNDGYIMFQNVAGGGFDELDTLGNLISQDQEKVSLDRIANKCSVIMKGILSDWATESDAPAAKIDQILQDLLRPRLAKGGTISAWAAVHPGLLDNPRPWLLHEGIEVVNPFALALDPAMSKNRVVNVILGKSHGDLHPNNILVPRRWRNTNDSMYWLVDLSRYSNHAPLGWDPVYLATTIIASILSSLSTYQRSELARLFVDSSSSCSDDALDGLHRILIAIDEAGMDDAYKWSTISEWRKDALICKIVAGLVMSGRQIIPASVREWFFWTAAKAATELMRQWDLYHPHDAHRLPETLIEPLPSQKRMKSIMPEYSFSQQPLSEGTDSSKSGSKGGPQAAHQALPTVNVDAASAEVAAAERAVRSEGNDAESGRNQPRQSPGLAGDEALVDSYRPINALLTVTTNQLNALADELADELDALQETRGPELSYNDLTIAREIAVDASEVLAKIPQAILDDQPLMDVEVARSRFLGMARVALADVQALISAEEHAIPLNASLSRPLRRLREAVTAMRVPDALSVRLDLS